MVIVDGETIEEKGFKWWEVERWGWGTHQSHPQKWQEKQRALGSGQVQARLRLLSGPNHSTLQSWAHRRTASDYLLTRWVPMPLQTRQGRRNVRSGMETV